MRTLASVRHVRSIAPIAQADNIVVAQVDGWHCVVKKDEFKPGDLGVYFEIDSFLPESDERYSFLSPHFITYNNKRGARLRTMKLRGQISQGLLLPIELFPEIENPAVGQDVTQLLGIEKWEPAIPAQLAGEVVGPMPSEIPRTDQTRIQSLIDDIAVNIAGHTFEQTIKLDGASMTVYRLRERQGVCSRNWEMRETSANTLWRVARRNKLLEALALLGRNLALQGELIGDGIQENHEKIRGHEFYLFSIFDIDKQVYLGTREVADTVEQLKQLGAIIHQVPSLGEITFAQDVSVEDILDMADGPSLFADKREGLVYHRKDGLYSFKAISQWYAQKYANR